MKYDIFLANYLRMIFTTDRDALFSTLQVNTGGLSSPRTASLLNMACHCMEEGERYVEVGVFTGYTLISAGYDNGRILLGVDSFDTEGPDSSVGSEIPRQVIKDQLARNMDRFKQVRANIIESDFRKVDLTGAKTGVAYIDGRHDYKSVIDNLEWLHPSLAKDAVLIFDDPDCEGVADAILDWCHDHKDYELLYISRSRDMFHRAAGFDGPFINGLAVAHYKGTNGL